MARPNKQGLDYFPLDVDFFIDEKIKFIGAIFGNTGLVILQKIFCRIYRNGYYTRWDDDEVKIFAKYDALISEEDIKAIVMEALKRKIFNEDLYKKYHILTSRGIQKRYFIACAKRKKIEIEKHYILVNLNDYGISVEVNSEFTTINAEIITQSKGEENKKNEERNKINISLSQFYNTELSKFNRYKTPTFQAYSKLVDFIYGVNDLNLPLNGLEAFNDQLSFEQFTQLWDNNCGVLSSYQNALLKINDNINYQKGISLFVRLKSWFDQEKNPSTLNPNIKPKKILPS